MREDSHDFVNISDIPEQPSGKRGIGWLKLFRELPEGKALFFKATDSLDATRICSAAYKSAWYLTQFKNEPTKIKTKKIPQGDGTYKLYIWKIEKEE